MKDKPYIPYTLTGAQAEVRRLRKQVRYFMDKWEVAYRESGMLAKLAVKGPAFDSPTGERLVKP